MGLARKDALKRMNGLKRRIEEHIQKLAEYPDSQDNAHWRGELHRGSLKWKPPLNMSVNEPNRIGKR